MPGGYCCISQVACQVDILVLQVHEETATHPILGAEDDRVCAEPGEHPIEPSGTFKITIDSKFL